MNDTFGRQIKEGDLVAYSSNSDGGPCLSVGRVLGACKNGSNSIRVHVFHSHTRAARGLAPWSNERLRVEGAPYVATVGRPERIIVLNGADVPLPDEARDASG